MTPLSSFIPERFAGHAECGMPFDAFYRNRIQKMHLGIKVQALYSFPVTFDDKSVKSYDARIAALL